MIDFNFDPNEASMEELDDEISRVEDFLNTMEADSPSGYKLWNDIHDRLQYLYAVRETKVEF
jgi:hypothetical protein